MKNSFNFLLKIIIINQISAVASAGIYEPSVLWNKKEISACFLDQPNQLEQTNFYPDGPTGKPRIEINPVPFTTDEKKLIKEVVTANYNPEDTIAFFVGWQECSSVTEYDLVISKGKPKVDREIKGAASIGQAGARLSDGTYKKADGLKSFLILIELNPVVIAHEFGHSLGLRHEHIHPNTQDDRTCSYKIFYAGEGLMKNPTAIFHTPYDSNSVMSYCVARDPKRWQPNQIKFLSDLDKETIRFLYLNKEN